MMTVYVALQDLPLSIGETGPCHIVTSDDVETYEGMSKIDESSVPVFVGEQLCEIDLLKVCSSTRPATTRSCSPTWWPVRTVPSSR